MPARGTKNKELYIRKKHKNDNDENITVRSKIDSAARYNKDLDQIAFRVPGGYKQKLKDWVAESDKYESITDLFCQLLEKETGMDFRYRK